MDAINHYLGLGSVPGGTHRNFSSYGEHLSSLTDRQKALVCDPQTSGGLLLAVKADKADGIKETLAKADLHSEPIGHLVAPRVGKTVTLI